MGWLLFFLAGAWAWSRRKQQQPGDALPPAQACDQTRRDGPYEICLWILPVAGGGPGVIAPPPRWRWRAELVDPVILPEGVAGVPESVGDELDYPSVEEAIVAAWRRLAPIDYGPDLVIAAPSERHGLRLNPNGVIVVTNQAAYVNHASPIISQATAAGDDGAGVVISVLMDIFGTNWNPLRVRIAGGSLMQAAARVDAVQPPNPPAVARALMGI